MLRIAYATGAKLRIRGRGSGWREGARRQEAPVPLMLAITAPARSPGALLQALRMALRLLELRGRLARGCAVVVPDSWSAPWLRALEAILLELWPALSSRPACALEPSQPRAAASCRSRAFRA